jgi:hypothetical protein
VGSQRDAYSLTGSRRNREKSSGIRGDNVRGAAVASTVLLQLRVLRLGFFQNGDVGVGVFPEGEEVFVSGAYPDAGSVGISAL